MNIKQNLAEVQSTIAALSKDVTLVAVSKFHNVTSIMEAVAAGQRVFAENRVQESREKWPDIKKNYPDIKLHLIGTLQTNKASDAVELFDVIESLDRIKLADCLIKAMRRQNRFIPCLIQINIGREPQKSGIMPQEADNFINYCKNIGLIINGLMCIPPENENPVPSFMEMVDIAKRNNLPVLSMGMSGDFKAAIECGSTSVRIGTSIFGERSH
jgi:pyridoxal phosphate enzyme (YggS family)